MSSELKIRTPEGIDFSLPLAGPAVRCLACLVDTVCVFMLIFAVSLVIRLTAFISVIFPMRCWSPRFSYCKSATRSRANGFFRGQTVGKRLFKLRVVDESGLRLEFTQVVIRNLMRFVDAMPAFYAVGGIACFFSRRRQRLGDLAANTVVVRHLPMAEPDLDQLALGKFNSMREYGRLAARLRQRVSPREAGIALEALVRRDAFDPEARVALFAGIAGRFKIARDIPARSRRDPHRRAIPAQRRGYSFPHAHVTARGLRRVKSGAADRWKRVTQGERMVKQRNGTALFTPNETQPHH